MALTVYIDGFSDTSTVKLVRCTTGPVETVNGINKDMRGHCGAK